MKISSFILLLLLSVGSQAFGQHHFILDRFQATKDKERVILTWSVKQGNTCAGIGILRSTDLINFEQIGEIQGICGSNESAVNYTFIDDAPVKNTTNYYVLELGFSGRTEPPLAIEFIDLSKQSSKVVPNPNNGDGYIHFDNPNNENHQLLISDARGRFVYIFKTNQDKFGFSLTELEENNYLTANYPQELYNYMIVNQTNKIISSGTILAFLK